MALLPAYPAQDLFAAGSPRPAISCMTPTGSDDNVNCGYEQTDVMSRQWNIQSLKEDALGATNYSKGTVTVSYRENWNALNVVKLKATQGPVATSTKSIILDVLHRLDTDKITPSDTVLPVYEETLQDQPPPYSLDDERAVKATPQDAAVQNTKITDDSPPPYSPSLDPFLPTTQPRLDFTNTDNVRSHKGKKKKGGAAKDPWASDNEEKKDGDGNADGGAGGGDGAGDGAGGDAGAGGDGGGDDWGGGGDGGGGGDDDDWAPGGNSKKKKKAKKDAMKKAQEEEDQHKDEEKAANGDGTDPWGDNTGGGGFDAFGSGAGGGEPEPPPDDWGTIATGKKGKKKGKKVSYFSDVMWNHLGCATEHSLG